MQQTSIFSLSLRPTQSNKTFKNFFASSGHQFIEEKKPFLKVYTAVALLKMSLVIEREGILKRKAHTEEESPTLLPAGGAHTHTHTYIHTQLERTGGGGEEEGENVAENQPESLPLLLPLST